MAVAAGDGEGSGRVDVVGPGIGRHCPRDPRKGSRAGDRTVRRECLGRPGGASIEPAEHIALGCGLVARGNVGEVRVAGASLRVANGPDTRQEALMLLG